MASMKNRRSFLAQVTGVAVAGGAAFRTGSLEAAERRAASTWDLAWLDGFKGKHKQVYDLMWHTLRPNTLNPPMNYLDIHKEIFGLEFPDINVAIGANSTGFPINASDALWTKFKLGERYTIKDPDTGQPATRNVYLGSVRALQSRGALFMMCNNALRGIARDFSRQAGTSESDMHAELIAGLNPGVRVVPALTWAVGMLQERGFTYEKL